MNGIVGAASAVTHAVTQAAASVSDKILDGVKERIAAEKEEPQPKKPKTEVEEKPKTVLVPAKQVQEWHRRKDVVASWAAELRPLVDALQTGAQQLDSAPAVNENGWLMRPGKVARISQAYEEAGTKFNTLRKLVSDNLEILLPKTAKRASTAAALSEENKKLVASTNEATEAAAEAASKLQATKVHA